MILKEITKEQYLEYMDENNDEIYLGLIDLVFEEGKIVEEITYGVISFNQTTYQKKNIFISNNGLFLLNPNLATLKVFEIQMKKYLLDKKVKAIKLHVNGNLDLKQCGLKMVNDKCEFFVHQNLVSKLTIK